MNLPLSNFCLVGLWLLFITPQESAARLSSVVSKMALAAGSRRLAGLWARKPAIGIAGRWVSTTNPDFQQQHPKPTPLPKLKDNFLDGTSSTYLEEMEERYQKDPSSVDKTWAGFFSSLGARPPCLWVLVNTDLLSDSNIR